MEATGRRPEGLPMAEARDGPRLMVSRRRLLSESLFVVLFSALLFAGLGQYALWDDEANTALFARSLWHSGDLEAFDGRNVIAYSQGFELTETRNRQIPPLQYVLAAPFAALEDASTFVVRLPFALCGAGLALLVCAGLRRAKMSLLHSAMLWLLILGNVSLILYLRQARYYAPAIVLTVAIAYLYATRSARWRSVIVLGLCGGALFLTHYLAYVSLVGALGVDYLLWGRRERRVPWSHIGALVASQLTVIALYVVLWEPTFRRPSNYQAQDVLVDKLKLLWWNLRDFNACEFSPVWVLLAAPVIYFATRGRDPWLMRASLGLIVVALLVTLGSPQPVGSASVADIRYLAAAIPFGIFVVWRVTLWLESVLPRAGLALAAVVAFTNVLNAPFPSKSEIPVRSTLGAYLGELVEPYDNAYRVTARWLEANVAAGATAWVAPNYATYPLMWHVPKLTYAWQLHSNQRASFPGLPDIHFRGSVAPDYLIGFARDIDAVLSVVAASQRIGTRYERVALLDTYGADRTRPELFWRSFSAPTVGRAERNGVVIYRKVSGTQPRP